MLNYLLIAVSSILAGFITISKKTWQKETVSVENAMPLYVGVMGLCSIITFFITAKGNVALNYVTFWYSFAYAGISCLSLSVSIVAFSKMSLVLYAVFTNLSTLFVWFYGIIFMNDAVTVKSIIAAALFAITVFIPMLGAKRGKTKAIGYILGFATTLIGTAATIVVKYYSISPSKMSDSTMCFYTNVFMFAAIVVWQLFCPSHRPDREDVKKIKGALVLIPIAAVLNNISAMTSLFILKTMPVSVYSVVSAAMGCIVVFVNSKVVFREKVRMTEVISLILSTGAAVISVI